MEYINSTGRRKAAVARVFLKEGTGNIVVNTKDYKNYFPSQIYQLALTEPLRILESEALYDVKINVHGGGMKGQAEAIRLGLARALVKDAELKGLTVEREEFVSGEMTTVELNESKVKLKTAKKDILTRDARVVERKKPGLRKARKKVQFSKR